MEILNLFGRLHPLILHLPIGVLLLAFLMAWLNRKGEKKYLGDALGLVLKVGMFSAIFAAISGYVLSLEGGYEETMLSRHQWFGIATAVGSILIYYLHRVNNKKLFLPTFAVLTGLIMITGHLGGSLTHGIDFMTEPFSPQEKDQAGIQNLEEAVVFSSFIEPIMKAKCVSCHNTTKLKGKLLLSTIEGIEKGGKTGGLVKMGSAKKSLMMKRIHMPEEEKKHMPPKGKKQLTKDEIALLEWWIDEKGGYEKVVSELERSDEINEILNKYVQSDKDVLALNVSPAKESTIRKLQEMGVEIEKVSSTLPFLKASLAGRQDVNPRTINQLKKISEQLVSLDLSRTNVDDKMVSGLKAFTHLKKLYLQKTGVTGKELKGLSNLEYLEYLNLFETEVDDDGMNHLAKMNGLKDVYLWRTNVSPSSIEKLKVDRPLLHVNAGADKNVFGSSQLKPPLIEAATDIFTDTMSIVFTMNFKNVNIYYTTDGTTPDSTSIKYDGPIILDKSTEINVIAQKEGWETSEAAQKVFSLAKHKPQSVELKSGPHQNYPGLGAQSLTDFKKGTVDFREAGFWLGYQKEHFTATFDMGKMIDVSGVTASTLEDTGSYIFAPTGMVVSISDNGRNFERVAAASYPTANGPIPPTLKSFSEKFDTKQARFVKVEVKSKLTNPAWHPAPGAACWLFIDEIIIE